MARYHQDIVAEVEQRHFRLTLTLLKIYNYYRVIVGAALLLVFLQPYVTTRLGQLYPNAFLWLTMFYTALNLISALSTPALPRRLFRNEIITTLIVLGDVVLLTVLMYLSGGVSSGLGAVVLVSVAAGAILVTGRTGLLLAAVATIAVLYEEFYLSLATPAFHDDYFQAGVLGTIYFATAISIQTISARMRRSEITSLERAAEVADLERVNRSIVTRMRTGIIVVNPDDEIRMINQSARSLLGLATREDRRVELPDLLRDKLLAWRADTTLRMRPFQVAPTTPEIRANFSPVRPADPDDDVIIFLEDTTEIQQHAQQLKLAALGGLSASIAHEIRNPLNAIGHAAQLLSESQNLDRGDTRLTDIIHSHVRRMNGVIENVLELSRRKPPVPLRLALADWLSEFVNEYRQSDTDNAEIEVLVVPEDTEVRVDPSQLSQALINLVQNGLRYSRETLGRPKLRLEGGVDETTERPYLNVIDFGSGVPEDKEWKLFEPFFTTERTGTGLGLYITRELCEANQARIAYTRHAEGGSCFRINFAHPDRITA